MFWLVHWLTIPLGPHYSLRQNDVEIRPGNCEEELKSLLMKVKEEWKSWHKLNIQKAKIIVSGPINSWQIDGETMEIVTDYFLRLQNHCRWWLQPWNWKALTPWKESYDQSRQHIQKRNITLPTMVHLVKAMVFPVVMYGCESWTIKKAERWELMLLNCGVREDSWEYLGLQGDKTSHL